MYELVQEESGDPEARWAAAEALTRFGLLRRKRIGPSRAFLWLLALTLLIVAAAAADTIGPVGGVALFAAGAAGLAGWYRHAARGERESGAYVGPDGATIELPASAARPSPRRAAGSPPPAR